MLPSLNNKLPTVSLVASPTDRPGAVIALSPNSDFYMSASEAGQIMNADCFSEEVRQFLYDEEACLRKVFSQEQYECIVEVGCHAGHNASWLSQLCTNYVGIDINAEAIEEATQTRAVPGKVEFLCGPVETLMSLLSPAREAQRTVVLFPFNLFGNFVNVEGLIKTFEKSGVDLAMSNFNTNSATTIGRYHYYANCFGPSSIRVYDAKQGVLFKAGRQFQSIAYNSEYLTKLVHEISHYHGIIRPFSVYGDLILLIN